MVKEIVGDIFKLLDTKKVTAIAHGCNRLGIMGGGVAWEVNRRWPDLSKAAAREWPKLVQLGECHPWYVSSGVVLNLITQPFPGPCAQLEAIRMSVRDMDNLCKNKMIESVALPWIGAGIGGLKWPAVRQILLGELSLSPVEYFLVEWDSNA